MTITRTNSIFSRVNEKIRLLSVACLCFLAGMAFQTERIHSQPIEAASDHLYELMIYHAMPGKALALESIFQDVSKLQARHGLSSVGYWVPQDDSPEWKDTFVYMVAHRDRQSAEANWNALHADAAFHPYRVAASPLIQQKRWKLPGGRGLHAPYRLFPRKVMMRSQMRFSRLCVNAFTKAVLIVFLLSHSDCAMCQRSAWIATWATSPEPADADPDEPLLNLNDQTVRERIRITLGGSQIRIRLSNEYGSSPVFVGKVSVGRARTVTDVVSGSLRGVAFGGKSAIVISPGAAALSDPADIAVKSGSELAISLYFPKHVTSVTWHSLALRDAAISPNGDHTGDITIEGGRKSDSTVFLSQVLVPKRSKMRVIVAFGDSLVDGDKSTPEADHAWPSDLFRRLQQTHDGYRFTVVNEGVAGNRLLSDGPVASLGSSGLARFERDALGVPGVTDIVLLEGTNDIGFPGARMGGSLLSPATDAPTAQKIIDGYKQLIAQAHARGIRIIGCTIMPTEGAIFVNYHNELKELSRQAVNHWIRTSHAFDTVIDFDAMMRDPEHPRRIIPRFASEDHLHPNDDGYQRMADAIDTSIFK